MPKAKYEYTVCSFLRCWTQSKTFSLRVGLETNYIKKPAQVHYIKDQVKVSKVTHFLCFRELDLWISSSFVLQLRCRGDERASEIPQMLKFIMTKAGNVSQLSPEPWIPQSTLIHSNCMKFDSVDGVFVLVNGLVNWDDYVQWVNSWNKLHLTE